MTRADARRNRERLVAAATAAFAGSGGSQVSLEAVARDAGVGIGTLYRHFPTREALVEEVHRTELAAVCDEMPGLLDTLPADVALRTWTDRYARFSATKAGMIETLRAMSQAGSPLAGNTQAALTDAVGSALERGVADGTLRGDVRPDDVVAALAGIMFTARRRDGSDQVDLAGRLLDLLIDGIRAPRTR